MFWYFIRKTGCETNNFKCFYFLYFYKISFDYISFSNKQFSIFFIIYAHRYILSLALADLLVIVTSVPFVSTIYTLDSWPWGEYICTLSEFVKDVSIGVSVFTLTALSSDRFFAIVDPLRKFHAHGKYITFNYIFHIL